MLSSELRLWIVWLRDRLLQAFSILMNLMNLNTIHDFFLVEWMLRLS